MSIEVMSRVWKHSEQRGGALLILLALADFADDDGYAWPAVQTLATKARMTERNARYTLRSLEAAGEITTTPGGGRYGTSGYVVKTGAEIAGGQNLPGAKRSTKGAKCDTSGGKPIAPNPSRLTTIEPSKDSGAHDAPPPAPVLDSPKPTPKPRASKPKAAPKADPAPREPNVYFDAFCKAFGLPEDGGKKAGLAGAFAADCKREGATLDQFRAFYRAHAGEWGKFNCTPHSVSGAFLAWRIGQGMAGDPLADAAEVMPDGQPYNPYNVKHYLARKAAREAAAPPRMEAAL